MEKRTQNGCGDEVNDREANERELRTGASYKPSRQIERRFAEASCWMGGVLSACVMSWNWGSGELLSIDGG